MQEILICPRLGARQMSEKLLSPLLLPRGEGRRDLSASRGALRLLTGRAGLRSVDVGNRSEARRAGAGVEAVVRGSAGAPPTRVDGAAGRRAWEGKKREEGL